MASPCRTVPLPGGSPWPSGRMSISQPAISSGLRSRPMPRPAVVLATPVLPADDLGAAAISTCATQPITRAIAAANPSRAKLERDPMPRSRRSVLRHFDILNLAILAQMPGLDAVVVVDRINATELAQLGLARLHVTGFVDRARLQQ